MSGRTGNEKKNLPKKIILKKDPLPKKKYECGSSF